MIMVQRESRVDPKDRAAFEEQSRDGLWPAFLHFGAPMVAYGTWGFGGPDDVVVTNTVYEDLDHWAATRMGTGAYYADPVMLEETKELRPRYAMRDGLVASSSARLIEIDDALSPVHAFRPAAIDSVRSEITEPRPAVSMSSAVCPRRSSGRGWSRRAGARSPSATTSWAPRTRS